MKLHHLDVLTYIVINVDKSENLKRFKNDCFKKRAISVVSKIKNTDLQIIAIQKVFSSMQLTYRNRVAVRDLVEMVY